MESRPEIETTAVVAVIPALLTHSLMPSLTAAGFLMLPSVMTSRASVTMAWDFRAYPPFVWASSTALIDRDPMSRPKVDVFFPRPNSAIGWLPALLALSPCSLLRDTRCMGRYEESYGRP